MSEKIFLYITGHLFIFLMKHKDFFEKSAEVRKELVKDFQPRLQEYLTKVSAEVFLQDLSETLALAKGKAITRRHNGLAEVMANFIMGTMGDIFDVIPMSLYMESMEKRKTWLMENKTPEALAQALSTSNYQDALDSLFRFVKAVHPDTPTIIIQSARDTDAKSKQEMRKHFREKYEHAFPIFQVAKYLYGGLRVFVDGEVTDESWYGKIQKFTTLLSHS